MSTLSIPLTQGKYALIDSADYPLVEGHKWHAVRNVSKHSERWYASTSISGKTVYMHRLLMGNPTAKVDHKNGDGLDNRRSTNLRIASNSGNSANAQPRSVSGFRGVFWDKGENSWAAEVYKSRRCRFFRKRGFRTREAAARAYDTAAKECHGEFAILNFPDDDERGVGRSEVESA